MLHTVARNTDRNYVPICFLLLSLLVVSDSLLPHGWQHARLPCPSLSPGVCSNSCPSSRDAIQPSHPLSSLSHSVVGLSQHQVFSNESVLHIRCFSISPSNEYSRLISFGIDWSDLLAVQGTSPAPHLQHRSSVLSLL